MSLSAASEPVAAAPTTRDLLVELAARVFATEGYASASVRDLGRRAGVTSGAIYGNFRGKADLLAEAIDARLIKDLWTLPDDVTSQSMLDIVAYQFEHYKSREELMMLVLEGALAARAEPEIRQRLQQTIGRRIDDSSASFDSVREAEGFSRDADLDAAVRLIWSIEIGMRVLSALGIGMPSEQECADVVRRFMTGLQDGEAPADAAVDDQQPAKAKAKAAKPSVKGSKPGARKAKTKKRPS
jgi:AcrR family transcriptional regulator